MAFFTALAIVMGISSLIGGITGMFTSEGLLQGAIQGANVIGNVISTVGAIGGGHFNDAAMHILGMSSQVISDIHSGEFKDRRVYGLEAIAGAYDYRDVEAHSQSLGMDALFAVSTLVGGKLLSHYSTQIGTALGKSAVPFILGTQIGSFQGKLDQIADVIEDLADEIDFDFVPTMIPAITVTGSPSRWDTGEGIIPGGLFKEDDEEERF